MALDLNGTTQYITVPYSANFGHGVKLSSMYWMYHRSGLCNVFQNGASSGNFNLAYQHNAAARVVIYVGAGSNFVGTPAVGGAYPLNQWNLFHFVFDGTQTGNLNRAKIFINGVLASTVSGGTIPAAVPDKGGALNYIGSNFGVSAFLNGLIKDFRMCNSEVYTNAAVRLNHFHHIGNDMYTKDLQLRLAMDEKSNGVIASGANSLIDLSGKGNHGTPVNSPLYKKTEFTLY